MTEQLTDTAIIFVDVQNDFCPGGKLGVTEGDKVVEPLNLIQRQAVDLMWLRVYGRDWHPKNSKHFIEFGGPWPEHCIEGTFGAEFHKDLNVGEDSLGFIISKGMDPENPISYSEFLGVTKDGKTLEQLLKEHRVKRVVVGGLATDYCVKETAKDAARLGFLTYVLTDAVKAVNLNTGDDELAFAEMEEAGVRRINTQHIWRDWA